MVGNGIKQLTEKANFMIEENVKYKNGIRIGCRTCISDGIHHKEPIKNSLRECSRCSDYMKWEWDGETYGIIKI